MGSTGRQGTALWVPDDLLQKAQEIAELFGKTRAEVVRSTLELFLPRLIEIYSAQQQATDKVMSK